MGSQEEDIDVSGRTPLETVTAVFENWGTGVYAKEGGKKVPSIALVSNNMALTMKIRV